jgi:hypothetical protein
MLVPKLEKASKPEKYKKGAPITILTTDRSEFLGTFVSMDDKIITLLNPRKLFLNTNSGMGLCPVAFSIPKGHPVEFQMNTIILVSQTEVAVWETLKKFLNG